MCMQNFITIFHSRPATFAYVGQGPAVLAAGAGRGGLYFFYLSSLPNTLSFGRRLNMTEIVWFRLLNPNGSCQLLPRTSSICTG